MRKIITTIACALIAVGATACGNGGSARTTSSVIPPSPTVAASSTAAPSPTPAAAGIAAAWATVSMEVIQRIDVTYATGTFHSSLDCLALAFASRGQRSDDCSGGGARAAVAALCPLAEAAQTVASSGRSVAQACTSIEKVLHWTVNSLDDDPISVSAARAIFDQAEQALVTAGASASTTSETARGIVLNKILTVVLQPYLVGQGDEARSTGELLSYLCPSMLTNGPASMDACRRLIDKLSTPTSIGGSVRASVVLPDIEAMLAIATAPAGTFNIKGIVTVTNPSGTSAAGAPCSGTGVYADLTEGHPVYVRDGFGAVIRTPRLGPGTTIFAGYDPADPRCLFEFTVEGLSQDASQGDRFSFDPGHQGGASFPIDALRALDWQVQFNLGLGPPVP